MGSGLDADLFDIEYPDKYLWFETIAILPHKCRFSKQRIYPFQKAMKGIRRIDGPGEPVFIIKWALPEEYTFAVLKGEA